jgi:hypothetical protein
MCRAVADICGVQRPAKYISGKNSTVPAAPADLAVGAMAPNPPDQAGPTEPDGPPSLAEQPGSAEQAEPAQTVHPADPR